MTWFLPYPRQLPQHYYAKNYTIPIVVETSPVQEIPIYSPPVSEITNYGGVYVGNAPPVNPLYGWLWSDGQGHLYIYQEPGIWEHTATNW